MRKTKIYLAGSVTSEIKNGKTIEQVLALFEKKQAELEAQDYHVINPVAEVVKNNYQLKSWAFIMEFLIPYLVSCDAIYIMKDWNSSRGVALERHIMLCLDKTIIYE